MAEEIKNNYGTDQLKVHEYYEMKASDVELVDLLEAVPEIGEIWPDRDDPSPDTTDQMIKPPC